MKLYKEYSRLNLRKNWFSHRVVQKWNSLTKDEVEAKKTSEFKAQYDKLEASRKEAVENDIYKWD